MADRYFSESPITEGKARLVGPEAHHLVHVVRAKPGSRVVLFDGTGAEFEAEVRRTGRNAVELGILSRAEVDRELPAELVLGLALPKGDRQKWAIEKAVELGVGRLVPLIATRSVAQPGPQAAARLRRAVIEASKQCGRNRLMEIGAPQTWADWLAAGQHAAVRLIAHPARPAAPPRAPAADWPGALRAAGPIFLAVGPEGGFTDDEVARAVAAGWQLVDLGPRILRIETAAVYLVALVAGRLGSA